jgi:hypothetical protein
MVPAGAVLPVLFARLGVVHFYLAVRKFLLQLHACLQRVEENSVLRLDLAVDLDDVGFGSREIALDRDFHVSARQSVKIGMTEIVLQAGLSVGLYCRSAIVRALFPPSIGFQIYRKEKSLMTRCRPGRPEKTLLLGTVSSLGRVRAMLQPFMRIIATAALLCAGTAFSGNASAQVFDFGKIDAFESLGSGTQHGGAPPKTIVDDDQRHTVLFTIIESNTEAKIHWRSKDGEQTTTIKGASVQAFQTAGEFRIEATGGENDSFKYGYVLFRLKNGKGASGDKI